MQKKTIISWLQKQHLIPIKRETPSQDGDEIYNYPSLDFVYNIVYDSFSVQQEYLNVLDGKANFGINGSTALISAGLALQSLLLYHPYSVCNAYIPIILRELPTIARRILPLLPLIISYLATVITSYHAYRVRPFHRWIDGKKLQYHLDKPEYFSKAKILSTMIQRSEENRMMLNRKAVLVDIAFKMLVVESLMLVFFLIFQVVC